MGDEDRYSIEGDHEGLHTDLARAEAREDMFTYLGLECVDKRPDPPGSSARARLESVTRVRGLVETAHNYLARTPEPPAPERFKEAALDAFDALERILVRWQGYEQDKLA